MSLETSPDDERRELDRQPTCTLKSTDWLRATVLVSDPPALEAQFCLSLAVWH